MSGLRPFFGFYGGKWRDTPKHYPAPRHDLIVEPFAGSAGYSMRFPWKRVLLVDVDPIITAVWRYLIGVSPAEVLAIRDLGHDETVDDLAGVPQEARWLVGFWLNRASSSPRRSPSSWMRGLTRPGSFWGTRVRQTIASQLDAIRHWQVRDASYADLADDEATWFVDPPYQGAGKHYRFSDVDYAHLAGWCRARLGQVIVCENSGATWLPFVDLAAVKTTRARSRSAEAVWLRPEAA